MKCQATRNNVILAALLATGYILSSGIAMAETSTVSAELKPLPLIFNAVPNSSGFGAEGEASLNDNVTLFGGVTHMHLKFSDRMVDDIQEDDSDKLIPTDIRSDAVTAGGRYYGNAAASSWYAGGEVGGGVTRVKWLYEDTRVTDRNVFYMAGVQGGYRWLWDNGFLIRVGGGLAYNTSQKRELSSDAEGEEYDKAKDKVEDQKNNNLAMTSAMLDFGLGYRF